MAVIRRIGFTRYSRWGDNLGRLTVSAAAHTDALDGTDELKITCSDDVNKGDYIAWADWRGIAHEHIIDEVERTHDENGVLSTAFTAVNSIAELWDDWNDDIRPNGGVALALQRALAGTRWKVGACDQGGSATATFYHQSARESIAQILESWGGELETTITHNGVGVTSRSVGVRARRGNQSSPKRFTWTKDIQNIKRTVSSENPKTRVYGYGKGVETDTGGYGRRLTFEKVNNGKAYVEDATATQLWGHPDGAGGVLPASTSYVNEQCEDAAQLLKETKAYLAQASEPKVSYTASVLDLYAFGRSWEGVAVGDRVAIIDKGFCDEGIRLTGRVAQIERDLLTADTTVTFGNLSDSMADMWASMSQALRGNSLRSAMYDAVAGTSVSWLIQLQDALNEQFNAVGTYKIETFELGTIFSNVPLDPETGLPLRSVSSMWAVNISGRGIRLASSLASTGQWDWKTFITGASVTADCINAGTMRANRIRAGLLTDETGANSWDLENGVFSLSAKATVGGKTVGNIAQDAIDNLDEALTQRELFNRLTNDGQTQGIYLTNGLLYINATYLKTGTISDESGLNYWNLDTGKMKISSKDSNGNTVTIDPSVGIQIKDKNGKLLAGTELVSGVAHFFADKLGRSDSYVAVGTGSDGYGGMEYVQNGKTALKATPVSSSGGRVGINLGSSGLQFLAAITGGGMKGTVIRPPSSGYMYDTYTSRNFIAITPSQFSAGVGAYAGITIGTSIVTVMKDSTHYFQMSGNNWFFRDGSKGFGWWNGAFSELLTWS